MARTNRPARTVCIAAAVVAATVGLLGGGPAARGDDTPGEVARKRFVLAGLSPSPPVSGAPADLALDWPAFRHEPFDKAGFNAVVLPFHYVDPRHAGDPDEANAFAFLLSGDLDWSPASYANRHAYFIFKRDRAAATALADKYDPAAVAGLVKGWVATHAVGGTITKSADGYSGELTVFGPDGAIVHQERFDAARPYFDLLGDLSAAALAYLGPKPNEPLVKHLHEPRCKLMTSVALLGSAAFVADQAAEFKLYDQILTDDPAFGQVRYWAANQGMWAGLDKATAAVEQAKSLDGYVTPQAAWTVDVDLLPADLAAKVPGWKARTRELMGADAPKQLAIVLSDDAAHGRRTDPAVVRTAVAAAAKYPNSYELLTTLPLALAGSKYDTFEPDLAAGLTLAAMDCRFLPGGGDRYETVGRFAANALSVGRPDQVVAVLADHTDQLNPFAWWVYLDGLVSTGRYAEALAAYDRQAARFADGSGRAEADVILAAGTLGRLDVIDGLLDGRRELLDRRHLTPLAEAYRAVLTGQPVDAAAVANASATNDIRRDFAYLALRAQLDLSAGKSDLLVRTSQEATMYPGLRLNWVLLDAYDRQEHHADSAEFYHALAFLYPDDPWARRAVAAWAKRNPPGPEDAADVAGVMGRLATYPAERFARSSHKLTRSEVNAARRVIDPWTVAAAVARLCDDGRAADARELALRYLNLSARLDNDEQLYWADHLYYQVDVHERTAVRP